MGFDAFGLPAENAAIKDGIHPMIRTYANIGRMRKQLRSMGAMFDWRREAVSSDAAYYKWSQWFFIQAVQTRQSVQKTGRRGLLPQLPDHPGPRTGHR
jgi:leucyl-tRNA synthetase